MDIYKVLFEKLYTVLTLLAMGLFFKNYSMTLGSYNLPKEEPKNI